MASPSLSFAQAAWGPDSLAGQQGGDLGVASALTDLAQGGYFASVGAGRLGPVRVAASFTSSPPPIGSVLAGDRTRSSASAGAIALTARMSRRWTLGLTYSSLHENNALLGSTYATGGLLDLGDRRQSRLTALSSALDLGRGRALLAEASFADTDGAKGGTGLISQVSRLHSMAWGVSFVQGGAFKAGDSLSVSVRQPLRVTSGQAQMAVTNVDSLGYPVTTFEPVSLVPNGRETDVGLNYATPVTASVSFRGQVQYRSDADNIAGLSDVALHLGVNLAF